MVKDSNSSTSLYSASELCTLVGSRARELRLARGTRQVDLASAAGVTLSTLRRFERGSNVGFDAVVRVALALRAEDAVADLFSPLEPRTLEQILDAQKKRLRARKHT